MALSVGCRPLSTGRTFHAEAARGGDARPGQVGPSRSTWQEVQGSRFGLRGSEAVIRSVSSSPLDDGAGHSQAVFWGERCLGTDAHTGSERMSPGRHECAHTHDRGAVGQAPLAHLTRSTRPARRHPATPPSPARWDRRIKADTPDQMMNDSRTGSG